MITLFTHKRFLLSCIFILSMGIGLAQTKSTNIQTIEGKKFYIHKIEKSQSLFSISKIYTVSLEDIYKYNPELKTNGAKVDQEIKIPFTNTLVIAPSGTLSMNTATSAAIDTNKFITHKVAKSETVYSITRKYKISEKELAGYNPGITPSLREGQIIIVGEKTKAKSYSKEYKASNKETKTASNPKEAKTATFNLVDSSFLHPSSKPKKIKYTVGLILPFRSEATLALDLNELIKTNTNFPNVPALAVDFYLGFKKALDSLASKDFDVQIELYESDDKDSLKLTQIVSDPKFKDLDLIFGPLYANGFKTISKKAKEHGIPIVSPITTTNKILYNNIYISKTNPSQFTLLESLADYCMDSLMNANANMMLMILSDKDKKEMGFVNAFKKYYNEKQKNRGRLPKDTVTIAKGIEGLKKQSKPNVKNIVVILSGNQVFLADMTTQIAMFANNKDFILCGWQSLSEFENIDQEYLNQLNYVFPHQFNITNLAALKDLDRSYAAAQNTIPSEYYYIGFDIAYYYLNNLKSSGPDFVHTLNTLPFESSYMRFKFFRPDNSTGFDNRGVYIFKYANYHLQKTGWK